MGLAVNVWTVNAPDDLRAMVGAGVDTVITDRLGGAPGRDGDGREAGPCSRVGRRSRSEGDPKRLVTGPNGGERPGSTKMVRP